MKLLFCRECEDIFNLSFREKNCSCGKTKGKYLDNLNATYSGPAVPLGFSNLTFAQAIRRHSKKKLIHGDNFTAFVIPKDCLTFKKEG